MPRIVEVARSDDVTVSRSLCDGGAADPEVVDGWELVLPRRGAFRRETDEGVSLVDSTTAYLGRPGQVHHVHHLHEGGDTGYLIAFSSALIQPVVERIPMLPFTPAPAALLAARALVAQAGRCADDLGVDEAASSILDLLTEGGPPPVRTRGARGRRVAVERVLERLTHEIESRSTPATLAMLAADVGYSPQHLSRTFRAVTGTTISRHRRALRARRALAQIEDGADDLSVVAADLGFSDHSHLVRVTRTEFGTTPTGLRHLLAHNPT